MCFILDCLQSVHHIGKSDKRYNKLHMRGYIYEDYNIQANLNLGARNSCWLLLLGHKPLKRRLKVGRKPSLLTSIFYISNLTIIVVDKIGFFWIVVCYCIAVV